MYPLSPWSTHTIPSVNPKSPFTSSSFASGEMSASRDESSLTIGLSVGVCARNEPNAMHVSKDASNSDFFMLGLDRSELRCAIARGAKSLACEQEQVKQFRAICT